LRAVKHARETCLRPRKSRRLFRVKRYFEGLVLIWLMPSIICARAQQWDSSDRRPIIIIRPGHKHSNRATLCYRLRDIHRCFLSTIVTKIFPSFFLFLFQKEIIWSAVKFIINLKCFLLQYYIKKHLWLIMI